MCSLVKRVNVLVMICKIKTINPGQSWQFFYFLLKWWYFHWNVEFNDTKIKLKVPESRMVLVSEMRKLNATLKKFCACNWTSQSNSDFAKIENQIQHGSSKPMAFCWTWGRPQKRLRVLMSNWDLQILPLNKIHVFLFILSTMHCHIP